MSTEQSRNKASPYRSRSRRREAGASVVDRYRFFAYAADADNSAIVRLDLASYEVNATEVDGAPEQIAMVGDHRLAITLRDKNEVALFEIAPDGSLGEIGVTGVPSDPWGLAVLFPAVSSWLRRRGLMRSLVLDAATLAMRSTFDVAREPRGVVVSPDGARAYVTHLVGDAVTVLDLDALARTAFMHWVASIETASESSARRGTLHPKSALAYSAVLSESGSSSSSRT